jgi:hypothetical protein
LWGPQIMTCFNFCTVFNRFMWVHSNVKVYRVKLHMSENRSFYGY